MACLELLRVQAYFDDELDEEDLDEEDLEDLDDYDDLDDEFDDEDEDGFRPRKGPKREWD